MHQILSKEIYPFNECAICSNCEPEIISKQFSPLGCDRCAMGKTPDRFSTNIKTQRELELESALMVLCDLKELKDSVGKNSLYNQTIESAWKTAKNLIK